MATVDQSLHWVQRPATRVPGYVAPATIDAALAALARAGSGARIVAGGTDLLVELDSGAHGGTELLVDVGRIPELALIEVTDTEVRLGAAVTHAQVVASPEAWSVLPLAQACRQVGSPQLRNRGTVAGNVVTASPANDTISALMALGASLEVRSAAATRVVPITEFITGFRSTVLEAGELVTAVIVPRLTSTQRGIFVKAGLRAAQAISVVHLAIVADIADDAVTAMRVAVGSVAPTVVVVPDSAGLVGPIGPELVASVTDATLAAIAPIDDLRAPASYRRTVVVEMVARALDAIFTGREATAWVPDPPLLQTAAPKAPIGFDEPIDAEQSVAATINGATREATGATGETLLDWLRDAHGLTGVKEGCAEGECGACTVLLDGSAVMSCLVPAPAVAGREVITVEGVAALASGGKGVGLHPLQEAFVTTGAAQCGFCTPGFIVAGSALLAEHPQPDATQITEGLAGNLCRCTGYRAIEQAVALAARSGSAQEATS